MNTTNTQTEKSNDAEKAMRESDAPTHKSLDELKQYIEQLVYRDHDYGTCVYAMSLAATAAFNFVASKLGVTGFQASCADLDVIRRTRDLKGPFMILKAEEALYPQYDLHANLDRMLAEARPWLAEQARANLAKEDSTMHPGMVHPDVAAHWRKLAAYKPEPAK